MQSALLSAAALTVLFFFAWGVNLYVANRRYAHESTARKRQRVMRNTMATLLLLLAMPKLFDLPQFASLFARYDIIAGWSRAYAYAYPFVEISLAVALLLVRGSKARLVTYAGLAAVMAIGLVGVGRVLQSGVETLRCACFGTLLSVPLSYASVLENGIMLLMALYLLEIEVRRRNRRVHFVENMIDDDVQDNDNGKTIHI